MFGGDFADLGPALLDQREVAGAHVEQGPVDADVEVGPAGEVADERRNEVAAAAEGAAAESQPERGQERPADFLLEVGLGLADRGRSGGDVGSLSQGDLQQLALRCSQIDQLELDQRAAGGLEPRRRVEVQPVGQPGRRDRQLFLGLEHVGPPPLPLGKRPIGVGVSTLADFGEMPRDLDDVVHLRFREALGLEDRLVAQQLRCRDSPRRAGFRLRSPGRGIERRSLAGVAASGSNQASVSGVRMFTPGISAVPAVTTPAPAPDVERLLRERDDLARRPLEQALMPVVAHA